MNNFTKILFLTSHLLLLTSPFCFSQNPDIKRTLHWYFGDGAGLDFTSGNPVADINANLYTIESSAGNSAGDIYRKITDIEGVNKLCKFSFLDGLFSFLLIYDTAVVIYRTSEVIC